MKVLFILFAMFISLECSAEDKKEQSQVKNQIEMRAALMNDSPVSKTAKYLNISANCRLGVLASVVVGGIFAGIVEANSDSFNTDNQKNSILRPGIGICGVSAIVLTIADLIYYKKAAKAAKMEIRPSHEGLGMNIAF